ncbi:MAG: helix-turn-helix domain-containing protein [Pirellulales bacterium]
MLDDDSEEARRLRTRTIAVHAAIDRLASAMMDFVRELGAEPLPARDAGTRLYTQTEVAERLQMSEKTVYQLRKSGRLKAVYPTPHAPRFAEADLAAFVERLRGEGAAGESV